MSESFESPLPARSPSSRLQRTPGLRSGVGGAGATEVDSLGPGTSPGAWFELFAGLRRGRKSAKRLARSLGEGVLLESFVGCMASDSRSELLKCSLLVCLQENCALFLEHDTKNMERVCALLSKMLEAGSAGPTLQCHILTTITCLLAELSVATRQQRLFEGFVEVLLGMVTRVNIQVDAALRATACECLHELEKLYPGLFHHAVGTLLVYAQTEASFAQAAYTSLFVTVAAHAIKLGRTLNRWGEPVAAANSKRSVGGGFLQPRSLVPFAVPLETSGVTALSSSSASGLSTSISAGGLFSPLEARLMKEKAPSAGLHRGGDDDGADDDDDDDDDQVDVPESVVVDVQRALQWVSTEAAPLTGAGERAQLMMRLCRLQADLFPAGSMPSGGDDWLRGLGLALLERRAPTLLAAVVRLRHRFGSSFFGDRAPDEMLLDRLIGAAHDASLPLELRRECVALIAEWGPVSDAPSSWWLRLWPHSFDEPLLASAKLQAMIILLSAPSASPPPQNLLSALSALSDFRLHDAGHPLARATFAVLRLVLLKLPGQEEAVYRFLLDLLVYAPRFVPALAGVLAPPASAAASRLLALFNQLLCGLESPRLVHYLPLAGLVCLERSVDPTLLLHRLGLFVQWAYNNPAARPPSDRTQRWRFGCDLLTICRSAATAQLPVRPSVWEPLCELLFLIASVFPDLEIRDRAHCLHRLVTHVQPAAAPALLACDSSSAAQVLLNGRDDTQVGAASSASKPARVLKSEFLRFERVEQPLVNAGPPTWSWSEIEQVADICEEELYELDEEDHLGTESAEIRAQLDAFLLQHPPRSPPMLKLALRLCFLKPGTSSVAGADPQQPENWVPECLVGPTLSWASHDHIRPVSGPQHQLEASLLRCGETVTLILHAQVILPLPSPSLKCTASFSCLAAPLDGDGDSGDSQCLLQCESQVRKLSLSLADFAFPLPHDPPPSLPVARALWVALWRRCALPPNGAASVVRVVCPESRITTWLRGPMGKFCISWQRGKSVRLLMFLPPSHHLLMQVTVAAEESLFLVRTDLWQVMAFVEPFLAGIP